MTGQRHLDDAEHDRMLRELAQHYGEPVRPVSEYCAAFEAWAAALAAKAKREDDGTEHMGDHRDEALRKIVDCLPHLHMQIYKSSMLGRLIYGGEKLRTEMCPEHKGRWMGLSFSESDCPHGCQLTGWLPASDPSSRERA